MILGPHRRTGVCAAATWGKGGMSMETTMRRYVKLFVIAVFAACLCARGGRAADLTVFAAASLQNAMVAIADVWNAETGGTLTLSFAGSSALARQVRAGAPADLVILANTPWMDTLESAGDIVPATRNDLLTNRLVVIAPHGAEASLDPYNGAAFEARLGQGRLALALVDAVPAGIYAKSALEQLGLWPRVMDRVVQTDNVRVALALVAARAATMGIVYATDARANNRVTIIANIPPDTHAPILYPIAATRIGNAQAARAFLNFLHGPQAQAIFTDHGFGLAHTH